jgi:hypothetical protein
MNLELIKLLSLPYTILIWWGFIILLWIVFLSMKISSLLTPFFVVLALYFGYQISIMTMLSFELYSGSSWQVGMVATGFIFTTLGIGWSLKFLLGRNYDDKLLVIAALFFNFQGAMGIIITGELFLSSLN